MFVIRWLLKNLLVGIVWVLLLSVVVNGKPLFFHAHEVLVENAVVEALDTGISSVWEQVSHLWSSSGSKNPTIRVM
jgi:hypothetical protein